MQPSPTLRRPTIAEIDLEALVHNWRLLRNSIPSHVKIMAVVKADAYHHGAVPIARALERCGVDYLAVALVEEGMVLREAGITTPIMLLSGSYGMHPRHLHQYKLQPVAYDLDTLVNLNATTDHPIPVHIKIDTGMGRLGFLPREIPLLIQMLSSLDKIRITGLLSHLSRSDDADEQPTLEQMAEFNRVIDYFHNAGLDPALIHISNSAGARRFSDPRYNMVRLGLSLYGIEQLAPQTPDAVLKPVMSLKTAVIQVKNMPPNSTISYGATFTTDKPSRIATLPIGYADGFNIRNSNRGEVLIRGQRAPVVGKVCMDLTMVDCTAIPNVAMGDEVVIFGKQGAEELKVADIAARTHTIPYEVLTSVSVRVPRVYINEPAEVKPLKCGGEQST